MKELNFINSNTISDFKILSLSHKPHSVLKVLAYSP
jgi:hypothetical protein